jgi:hypothetical protein
MSDAGCDGSIARDVRAEAVSSPSFEASSDATVSGDASCEQEARRRRSSIGQRCSRTSVPL